MENKSVDTNEEQGTGSIEDIAYRLYLRVKSLEGPQNVGRKWILDTFAECLEAARGERVIK